MIRYAFDSFSQLSNHLHVVDNSSLMFIVDPKRAGYPGAQGKVLLELEIRESMMKTVVRGEVVARAEGSLAGSWVQLSDLRLAKRLQKPEAFASRRERRVSAEQLVQLRASSGSQLVAQLLDVSEGGIRLRGAAAVMVGHSYDVRLLGARLVGSDLGTARAVRSDGLEAALRFDLRGSGPVKRYLQLVQDAWSRAPQVEHAKDCCARLGPIEPALPKLRKLAAL
jgi:hypothetical protein